MFPISLISTILGDRTKPWFLPNSNSEMTWQVDEPHLSKVTPYSHHHHLFVIPSPTVITSIIISYPYNALIVVRNYGQLLLDVVSTVPDGVCCFFTSYSYMEQVVNHWDQMRIMQRCMEHKLIYLETKNVEETTYALDNYKKGNR